MTHRLRKIGTGLVVATGLLVLSATPAEAADDYVSGSDVGPDKSDWFCTYQVSVDDIACTYHPGNGSTSGKQLVQPFHFDWPW